MWLGHPLAPKADATPEKSIPAVVLLARTGHLSTLYTAWKAGFFLHQAEWTPCTSLPSVRGRQFTPFQLHSQRAGAPAAWQLSCQGPRHVGPESDRVTWRIPHFLSSQLSTLPIAELGDLSRMLT